MKHLNLPIRSFILFVLLFYLRTTCAQNSLALTHDSDSVGIEYPGRDPLYLFLNPSGTDAASSDCEALKRALAEKDEWYFSAVGGQATYEYSASIEVFENCWVGAGVSHRSGILGLINGVHGASNFNIFFVESIVSLDRGPCRNGVLTS